MKTCLSKTARAMTKTEVLIIVAVLMLMAALFISFTATSHQGNTRFDCVNNLRQIGICFHIWAGDNNDKMPMQLSETNGGTMEYVDTPDVFRHFQVMSNEMGAPRILWCPTDVTRRSATNFVSDFRNARISYFVGVDANDNFPQMPLAGDRNLTLSGVVLTNGLHPVLAYDPVGWSTNHHKSSGNILTMDGDVQQFNSLNLSVFFRASGVVTNRLAVP